MNWFNRKREHLVGIDISSAVVKLVELSKKGEKYKVETYAVAPLTQEDIDNKISNEERISNAIKLAVKFSKTKTKHACVAVQGAAVKKSVIQLPIDLPEAEFEDMVMSEVDQQIEFSLDEMYVDFEILGVNDDNPQMQDVLFAASRQEHIIEKIDILKMADLTAKVVDVDTFAMENMFNLIKSQLNSISGFEGQEHYTYQEDDRIAIFDVGATMTTLMILHKGRHIYDTEQSFGGKQLTEAIQHRYQMSFSEAGYAKRQGGLLDSYDTEILEPFKQGLVREILRLLDRFKNSANSKIIEGEESSKIKAIVLAGGCASIEGIADFVQQALNLPTIVANPFADMLMASSEVEEGLYNDAPAMVIACGLALRAFD